MTIKAETLEKIRRNGAVQIFCHQCQHPDFNIFIVEKPLKIQFTCARCDRPVPLLDIPLTVR